MRVVIQRVSSASVNVDGQLISEIGLGFLVLLGVKDTDTEEEAKYLADKTSKLRVFEDSEEKMNLGIKEVNGEILVVSQFTLYGDATGGNRPSFIEAARPEKAVLLYEKFCEYIEQNGIKVKKGKFQAMMDVKLVNNGPVTIIIEK